MCSAEKMKEVDIFKYAFGISLFSFLLTVIWLKVW